LPEPGQDDLPELIVQAWLGGESSHGIGYDGVGPVALAAGGRSQGLMMDTIDRVLAACDTNRERDLADLVRLLSQPSISAQDIGVAECAELVRQFFTEAGLAARLLPTAAHPMVFAEYRGDPAKPTVLIYGHYDVQPPDPLDQWLSPPFEPTIRDGKLYARGAGDNKGQFFAQLAGIRAWLETVGSLPVNVKFLIEGEEETGSPHLDELVAQHADLLTADLVYTSDGPVFDDRYPIVVFGVRGMLYIELTARGASHDLHSGNWGGIAPNPVWALVRLLTTMLDDENNVIIDGFNDDIRAVSSLMRQAMDNIPLDQAATLAALEIGALPPPADVPYFDRLMARPTLNIAGFTSGYGGPGSKTVLPSRATVKIDMRLVPDQDPDDIFTKVRSHVSAVDSGIEIRHMGSMRPSATPLDHPFAAPVRRAVERGFGAPPVDVPLLGGSLPDAVWTRTLGLPSFLVPYANHDEDNHAPNENIVLDRFYAGVRTAAALMAELAAT
jgi:acetylornithine deacetylase/succinyl-diaminopimelate desuccinylase-like protein